MTPSTEGSQARWSATPQHAAIVSVAQLRVMTAFFLYAFFACFTLFLAPVCWTRSARPRWSRVKRVASRSTSAHTRCFLHIFFCLSVSLDVVLAYCSLLWAHGDCTHFLDTAPCTRHLGTQARKPSSNVFPTPWSCGAGISLPHQVVCILADFFPTEQPVYLFLCPVRPFLYPLLQCCVRKDYMSLSFLKAAGVCLSYSTWCCHDVSPQRLPSITTAP